jgi:cytochrome P450
MLFQISLGHVLLLLCSIAGSLVTYYGVQRTRHELRIRKIGGVKAPQAGQDPISATIRIIQTVQASMQNEMLARFNRFFDEATPESPNCVEIQIRPRQRYILTREPIHLKTILTTKFTEFGKGKTFHDLWKPFLGDSIFATDGQLWQESRSIIRPMFIKDRISDLETFERGMKTFLTKIPRSGGTVDLMDLFYRMTLDVTTEFLLGATIDSMNKY